MAQIEMVWEAPKERTRTAGRGGGRYHQMLEQLKAHPGQWAVVAHGKAGGPTTWWKKQGCESTTQRQEDGSVKTFARWPEAATEQEATAASPATATLAERATSAPATPATRAATRAAEPTKPIKPVEDTIQLPRPRTAALTGQRMGDCACGRRDVLVDTDGDCILCRTRKADAPDGGEA